MHVFDSLVCSLKKARSAREIQVFYRKYKSRCAAALDSSNLQSRPGVLVNATANHSQSNSMYVSALPSTVVDDDLSEESSNSVLLDITLATEASTASNAVRRSFKSDRGLFGTNVAAATAAAEEADSASYAQAVAPARLEELHHQVEARTARRAHSSGPLRAIDRNINNGRDGGSMPPSNSMKQQQEAAAATSSSPSKRAQPAGAPRTSNSSSNSTPLDRLRDQCDTLLFKHLRQREQGGGPEHVHARRARLAGRIDGLVERLSHPAKPEQVLDRAVTVAREQRGNAAEDAATGLRSSIDSAGGFSSGDDDTVFNTTQQHHGVNDNAADRDDGIERLGSPSLLRQPPYGPALQVVRWPSNMKPNRKRAAVHAHKAAVRALGTDRRWWQVYDPESGQQVDVRDVISGQRPSWPWASIDHGAGGQAQAGDLKHLPPKARDATAIYTPSPVDAMELAMQGMDGQQVNTTGSSAGKQQQHQQAAPSAFEPRSSPLGSSPPPSSSKHAPSGVDDSEASQWWMAMACAPMPLYSHIAKHGAPGAAGPAGGEPGAAGTHQHHHHNQSGEVKCLLPMSSPGSNDYGLDLTLSTACRVLGVIDPWSTSAAYMDSQAVSAAARAACAAAAQKLESSDGGDDAGGPVPSSPRLHQPGIDDLLDLSMEIAAVPALDFYSGQAQAGFARASAAAGPGLHHHVRVHGEGTTTGFPSLAGPGEPISGRVRAAYDALKRRLHMELGPSGAYPASPSSSSYGGSTSASGLAREVAARRIQRAWKDSSAIADARMQLDVLRERAATSSQAKMTLVANAMANFMAALEASTGIPMGQLQQTMDRGGGGILGGMTRQGLPPPAAPHASTTTAGRRRPATATAALTGATTTAASGIAYDRPPVHHQRPSSAASESMMYRRYNDNEFGGGEAAASAASFTSRRSVTQQQRPNPTPMQAWGSRPGSAAAGAQTSGAVAHTPASSSAVGGIRRPSPTASVSGVHHHHHHHQFASSSSISNSRRDSGVSAGSGLTTPVKALQQLMAASSSSSSSQGGTRRPSSSSSAAASGVAPHTGAALQMDDIVGDDDGYGGASTLLPDVHVDSPGILVQSQRAAPVDAAHAVDDDGQYHHSVDQLATTSTFFSIEGARQAAGGNASTRSLPSPAAGPGQRADDHPLIRSHAGHSNHVPAASSAATFGSSTLDLGLAFVGGHGDDTVNLSAASTSGGNNNLSAMRYSRVSSS